MQKWVVLWAGKHQKEPWDALCFRYRDRIQKVLPVQDLRVRSRDRGEGARQRSEAEALLMACPRPSRVIALDQRGPAWSSRRFAGYLERQREEWPHPLVFLIGSDLGLSEDVLSTADQQLSIGPMTLGHQLARLVLYEQLYRALAISRGIKYDRGSL